jgi:phospholipid/cholesterol/gamma-HCH transport system substrate-binding protein
MSPFSRKLVITTYFDNAGGMKAGAPVQLEGVTIGEVTRVEIVTDPKRKLSPVKIVMKLDPQYHSDLHTDSRASLATVGVLGDTVINISSQTAVGPELQSGDELKTVTEPGLQDIIKQSQGTVESANLILAKVNAIADTIQSGKGTAGKLINDPALYNEATATVAQLHTLTVNLNSGKGSAGKLLHDDELYDRLNDSAAKLDEITSHLAGGKGSAGKLLTDDKLYDNLNSTLAHANSLLAEADAGKGSLGILLKDPSFANKLSATVDKLDTLLGNVNSGKGTLGKLATDDAAYANLNKLLTSSTDLVTTIRSDPKKYLTIHLKIF